jgi:hypothetical protein
MHAGSFLRNPSHHRPDFTDITVHCREISRRLCSPSFERSKALRPCWIQSATSRTSSTALSSMVRCVLRRIGTRDPQCRCIAATATRVRRSPMEAIGCTAVAVLRSPCVHRTKGHLHGLTFRCSSSHPTDRAARSIRAGHFRTPCPSSG